MTKHSHDHIHGGLGLIHGATKQNQTGRINKKNLVYWILLLRMPVIQIKTWPIFDFFL